MPSVKLGAAAADGPTRLDQGRDVCLLDADGDGLICADEAERADEPRP